MLSAHRLLSALITNGSASMVCHAVYYDPQHADGLEDHICDTIVQRIATVSQAPHVVGGDFQGEVMNTRLGHLLCAAGWLNHAHLVDSLEHVTNRPYRGRPALLDDIWFGPQLTGMWRGLDTEWSASFSTHAILTLGFEFGDSIIEGAYLKTVMTKPMEEKALTNPFVEVWEEAVDWSLSANELFDIWLCRLNRFLGVPNGTLGRRHIIHKQDRQDGQFPINFRPFQRANLARKVNAWFQELANLQRRYDRGELSQRACALMSSLQRIPWSLARLPRS